MRCCLGVVIDSGGCVMMHSENDPKAKEQEKKHQQRIYESFRSGPFEEIVARSEANVILHVCLLSQQLSFYTACQTYYSGP